MIGLVSLKEKWKAFIDDMQTGHGVYKQLVNFYYNQGFDKAVIDEVIEKFISYWNEWTLSGKKVRWQTEKTFDIPRRLNTFFQNHVKFGGEKTVNANRVKI